MSTEVEAEVLMRTVWKVMVALIREVAVIAMQVLLVFAVAGLCVGCVGYTLHRLLGGYCFLGSWVPC